MGCLVCLLGSTIIVLHAPKEGEIKDMNEMADRLKEVSFIIYVVIITLANIWLIFFVGPRFGQTNAMIYVLITGSIGSLSVMSCKGLGVALKATFSGHNELTNRYTWIIVGAVIFCISIQMNYLNKALDIFNTSVVTPMLYVVFTTFVIIASAILFKEWNFMTITDVVGVLCGFGCVICGIFLLHAFKDLNLSKFQLIKQLEPKSSQQIDDESRSSLLEETRGRVAQSC